MTTNLSLYLTPQNVHCKHFNDFTDGIHYRTKKISNKVYDERKFHSHDEKKLSKIKRFLGKNFLEKCKRPKIIIVCDENHIQGKLCNLNKQVVTHSHIINHVLKF